MTSRAYWRKRSFALENLIHREADRTVEWIVLLYEEAAARILEQVESVYNTYSRKSGLNPDQVNALLSTKQTAQARSELLALYQNATGQAKQDIWNRLAAPAYAYRISRLQATRDRAFSEVKAVYGPTSDRVQSTLENAYTRSYYQTVFDIQQQAGAYFDFNRLSDNQVRVALATHWNGENYSERLWNNNQAFADAVEQAVVVGLLAGLRYDEMRDNLLHIIGMDSTHGAQYKAARLVRTECAYVCNEGHMQGYREADIEKYIFLATLDTRTTETCRPLDMKRFPVDEAQPGTNMPPMHPNCRCTTMPDMSNEKLARVKRAARDPVTGKSTTVPGNMTYQQWYAKYVEGNPAAEANDRYRSGKVLYNAAGQPIIQVGKTTAKGSPNSITQVVSKKGGISRNYYDAEGNWSKQISNNNHGNSKRHPYGENGEHAHDVSRGEDGEIRKTTRELTEAERRENQDVL